MVTAQQAKSYTKPVPDETHFITNSGARVRSIYELYDILTEMSEEDFQHHVNEERHDFKNWILHVIKDEKLAHEISANHDKGKILDILEERIGAYNKLLHADEPQIRTALHSTIVATDERERLPRAKEKKQAETLTSEEITTWNDKEKNNEAIKKTRKKQDAGSIKTKVVASKRKQKTDTEEIEEDIESIFSGERRDTIKLENEALEKSLQNELKSFELNYEELEKDQKIQRMKAADFIQGLILGIIIGIMIAHLFI